MKIAEVRAHWLRYPIPEQSQHTSDFGRLRNFDMVLVEIHDTGGRIGYGEAKAGVGSSSFGGALVALLRDEFAPLLVGQDPRNITRLWDLLYNGSRFAYARTSGRTFPELDRRGSRISALRPLGVFRHDCGRPTMGCSGWRPCAAAEPQR